LAFHNLQLHERLLHIGNVIPIQFWYSLLQVREALQQGANLLSRPGTVTIPLNALAHAPGLVVGMLGSALLAECAIPALVVGEPGGPGSALS
jgi:hypothetical protein